MIHAGCIINNKIAEETNASMDDTGLFSTHWGNRIKLIIKAALQAEGAMPEKMTNNQAHKSAISTRMWVGILHKPRINMHAPNRIPICNPEIARI